MWEERCYSDGIPDEIPSKLAASGRVPSWKTIAIAILKNDYQLKSLGFDGKYSPWADELRRMREKYKSGQGDLF